MFARVEINDIFGAAFVSGGRLNTGEAACDMWSLNLEKLVSYVETPKEATFENLWIRLDLKDDPSIFC